jgi:hypothetical protein
MSYTTEICQNVECNNIGRKVTVKMIMEPDMRKEIHDIYLCQICINLENARHGGLKN